MKILHGKTALLIAGALTLHASTTWAATCAVPTLAYPTIQSAVNDPVCTTINVAPGIYNENVTINRSLTLNGAQAGQAVALRTAGARRNRPCKAPIPPAPCPSF